MAVARHLRHQTAQQVQLIRSRHRDHQIRLTDVRLQLYGITGTVSHISHNIILVAQVIHHSLFLINNGNIVPFLTQNGCQRLSNLSAAHNYNLHFIPP